MSLSMHSTSVPTFTRTLTAMSQWLDAAEAQAKERGFEVDNYIGLRLAPDMLPFSRQIQIASDGAKNCVARLAGLEPPKWADDEASIDELRTRIALAYQFALSRSPTEQERQVAETIVRELAEQWRADATGKADSPSRSPDDQALVTFCHALMNSAAFLYID